MKKICIHIICFLLLISLLPAQAFAVTGTMDSAEEELNQLPYADISSDLWSYAYIAELYDRNIFPDCSQLNPSISESRGNFVQYLYLTHLNLGGKQQIDITGEFQDVSAEDPRALAISWAYENGIVNGISETLFAPDANLTRAHICTILMRYMQFAEMEPAVLQPAQQFRDSLKISEYARTPVVVCQMAGLVNGYNNGKFRPDYNISRQECAAVLCRLLRIAEKGGSTSAPGINLTEGAYDFLYNSFQPPFDPVVPAGKEVDLSYFDRVAFVGDSVSLRLQYYCAATGALGNATFLCAGSMSASNVLGPVGSETCHPSYQGKKMLVEDAVAASGVEIVYIMLGMNNISFGIERASNDMITLIDRILEKSPDVQIVIQSVTPMSATSSIYSGNLNNENIALYNDRMKEICEDRNWYFINVAEVVTDPDGYLYHDFCSDNAGMGIHMTNDGAVVWVDYLKTHVPYALVK